MSCQPVFYKILNKHGIHNGYRYSQGLNILNGPFNNNPYQSCAPGGFYITTKEHLHKYLHYGVWIVEVYLPTWLPGFEIVPDPQGDKWRVNMLILGRRFHIFQMNMYLGVGLDVTKFIDHPTFVPLACKQGRTDVLTWIKCSSCYQFNAQQIKYIADLPMVPPNVLEWFKLNIPNNVNFDLFICLAIRNWSTATALWLWNNRNLIYSSNFRQLYDYLKRMYILQ